MQTLLRPFVFMVSLLGCAAFGALLLASLLQSTWIERGARELIRQQIEKKTGETLQALDARFLSAQARVFLRGKEQEIAAARKTLAEGLPARIAAIAAEMGIPECECRQRRQSRLELQIGTAQQMQAQLDALIRTAYIDTANKLLRELRIFSGVNALAFALLGVAAWRQRPSERGTSLIPATATLLVATLACSALYLFGQNWLHTVVFGNYVGWAQLAYIAVAYAWLCDLLLNRGRVSAQLFSGSVSGALTPC